MRVRLAFTGGGRKSDNGGSGQQKQNREPEGERGSMNHGTAGNSSHEGVMRSVTNAVGYEPHQMGGNGNSANQGGNGGGQMMAYSNMMAGDYGQQNNSGRNGYAMFIPGNAQNREMGFMAPIEDYESENRRRGYTRSEEYMPDSGDVEARRRRSKRSGRFIRGEGDGGAEMHYHSHWDDDDEDSGSKRGSYSRNDRNDREGGAGELAALRKHIKKLEERLEEAEEAGEHVRSLKKEVKRLKEALEGKDSGEGGEGRGKKEGKKHGKADEDDDEDDPLVGLKKLMKEGVNGKDFLKHLPDIFQAVSAVIADPPKTWASYLEKEEYSDIYVMEAKELMRAIEQYKSGQKGIGDVVREMKHTGAALIQMYANLLHKIEQK